MALANVGGVRAHPVMFEVLVSNCFFFSTFDFSLEYLGRGAIQKTCQPGDVWRSLGWWVGQTSSRPRPRRPEFMLCVKPKLDVDFCLLLAVCCVM